MAHLRSIIVECAEYGCTSRAVATVYTDRNDPCSSFCKRHADAALKRRQKLEDGWNAEARAAREATA